MLIILQTEELKDFCHSIKNNDYIAIDTEFWRGRKTYYPKCSLIQINGGGANLAIIDALKCPDLSPLHEIITNKEIIKIFHSCRQDIEVLYGLLKADITSVFDTQIGSMFLGADTQLGYHSLIKKYLAKDVNKSLQFSNWLVRPLSKAQLEYAEMDVKYLYLVYQFMQEELKKLGYYHWVREECDQLAQKSKPIFSLQKIFNKAFSKDLNGREAVIFYNILLKREEVAEKLNLNRELIINNNNLIKLAKDVHRINTGISISMDSAAGFSSFIESITDSMFKKREYILSITQQFIKAIYSDASYYANLRPLSLKKDHKQLVTNILNAKNSQSYSDLKMLLQKLSNDTGIALELLACKQDIIDIIVQKDKSRLSHGWRQELLKTKGVMID